MAGQQEKERGNKLFEDKCYEEALQCYTEAIGKNQKSAVFLTNRALCYLRLSQWSSVVEDCQKALHLDPSLIKAHFYKGQALIELSQLDSAIESLKTAHTLAREQQRNFGDEIAASLRFAQRMHWRAKEEDRLKEVSSLQRLLSQLLLEHRDRCLDEQEGHEGKKTVTSQYTEHMTQLQQLFEDADHNRKMRDIPDYLCGKISFEIMRDPVITPSGITYERKDIEEHLNRVGHFDPVTRQKLTQDQLIPNLAMKEVVDSFINDNAWVEQMS